MARIAIVTDSNCGISQEEAKTYDGVYVIPMPFTIDGEEFFEDINLSQEQFYEKLLNDAEIFTSQPTPQAVMDLWDTLLKDYDEIVHIPMSSGLSSSLQTAQILAEEYDDKVQVVDNQRISITLRDSIMDALNMIKKGMSAKEIKEVLLKEKSNQSIYISLDTLKYLKKGGRITPAAAALGTLLKIKPILQIQGDKLDKFATSRTVNSAKSTMIEAIRKDIEGRLSDGGKYKTTLNIAHSNNYEAAKQFREELKAAIPGDYDITINTLSLSISCHIGSGSLAVASSRIVD